MSVSNNTKWVKEIRRKTRRKFSSEDNIRIVLEGLRGECSIAELCRREGINANLYYRWSKDFLEAGKAGVIQPVKICDIATAHGQVVGHTVTHASPAIGGLESTNILLGIQTDICRRTIQPPCLN